MRIKILTITIILLNIAIEALSFFYITAPLKWWGLGLGLASLIMLAILYWSSVKPVIVARHGLDLLRAQDFNNRLVKVGEPGADKIVDLFNDLMT
ncbi:MAG: PAS domain-containing sensor histidine kinase, partial [Muribaculaceae bacterium]|nr:PAS domain-containing sensor histidine kinase [Muribaculaceae bacterium]